MALLSPGRTSLWWADNARKSDYHCLDQWTAIQAVSGRAVVKVLIRQRRKRTRRNGRESQRWHQRSRCQSSEALPVLGVPQLPIGRRLSKGVSARTVTFWRHHRRQQWRPPSLLPLFLCIYTFILPSSESKPLLYCHLYRHFYLSRFQHVLFCMIKHHFSTTFSTVLAPYYSIANVPFKTE